MDESTAGVHGFDERPHPFAFSEEAKCSPVTDVHAEVQETPSNNLDIDVEIYD